MIAVVQGGHESEAEISRVTSKAFQDALKELGKEFVVVEFDDNFINKIKEIAPSVCLCALHGTHGEDGVFQSICEFLNIPYTGSGVLASALCFDKQMASSFAKSNGVPVVEQYVVKKGDNLNTCSNLVEKWEKGFVVKPARSGSSRGVSLCETVEDLAPGVDEALKWDSKVLVERRVRGKEVTVSLLEGKAFEIIEIRPKEGFYDMKNKYTKGATDYLLPAPLSPEMTVKVKRHAEKIYETFGLKTYARVDFLVEDEKYFFMEVNTLPGCTPTSLFPMAAAKAGISFSKIIETLLEKA